LQGGLFELAADGLLCPLCGKRNVKQPQRGDRRILRLPIRSIANEIDARHMSMILLATRDAMRNGLSPQTLSSLAETTARSGRLHLAVARDQRPCPAPSGAAQQGRLGALFDRDIEQVFRA
jgi:hypothetical protein